MRSSKVVSVDAVRSNWLMRFRMRILTSSLFELTALMWYLLLRLESLSFIVLILASWCSSVLENLSGALNIMRRAWYWTPCDQWEGWSVFHAWPDESFVNGELLSSSCGPIFKWEAFKNIQEFLAFLANDVNMAREVELPVKSDSKIFGIVVERDRFSI